MSRQSDAGAPRPTLIGPKSQFNGELETEEELVILGQLTSVRVQSPDITIGPAARVRATVHTAKIRIEGVFIGDIHATIAVIVQANATVHGNIHSPSITIREGARVNGGANVGPIADSGKQASALPAPARALRRG